MWQLVAIVAIVVSTVIWFIRDERARHARALAAKAHYFAARPHYRPATAALPVAIVAEPERVTGLLQADRAYFNRLLASDRAGL